MQMEHSLRHSRTLRLTLNSVKVDQIMLDQRGHGWISRLGHTLQVARVACTVAAAHETDALASALNSGAFTSIEDLLRGAVAQSDGWDVRREGWRQQKRGCERYREDAEDAPVRNARMA